MVEFIEIDQEKFLEVVFEVFGDEEARFALDRC